VLPYPLENNLFLPSSETSTAWCCSDTPIAFQFAPEAYWPQALPYTPISAWPFHILGVGLSTARFGKGGTRALRDLDLFRPDKDCFATSLSSTDAALLKEWEPDSPSKEDRMDALKAFHDAGIFTWVSLEPVITPASSLAVIEATHPYVDLYKTGKMNARGTPLPPGYKDVDWKAYVIGCVHRCESLGKKLYVKESLQEHLPEGFVNEMRMTQHF